jgi:hypothetical protein
VSVLSNYLPINTLLSTVDGEPQPKRHRSPVPADLPLPPSLRIVADILRCMPGTELPPVPTWLAHTSRADAILRLVHNLGPHGGVLVAEQGQCRYPRHRLQEPRHARARRRPHPPAPDPPAAALAGPQLRAHPRAGRLARVHRPSTIDGVNGTLLFETN